MSIKKIFSSFGLFILGATFSVASHAYHDSALDPNVAQPLMMMQEATQMQCLMGNHMACQQASIIHGAAQEMLYYQTQCQQGNHQACQSFQMGVGQVHNAFQQFQNSAAPIQADPSYGQLSHEERMRLQQQAFDNHNQQWEQRQRDEMERNQRYLDNLLR